MTLVTAFALFTAFGSALAAAWNGYNAHRAASLTKELLAEQKEARSSTELRDEYRLAVMNPAFDIFVHRMDTEWATLMGASLQRLPSLKSSTNHQSSALEIRRLRRDLHALWDEASNRLIIGAKWWNPSLLRELRSAETDLEERVATLFEAAFDGGNSNAHMKRGRLILQDHLGKIVDLVLRFSRLPGDEMLDRSLYVRGSRELPQVGATASRVELTPTLNAGNPVTFMPKGESRD